MSTADLSHGITAALSVSGFTFLLKDVSHSGNSRETVDTSHQGTSDWMTALAADLRDPGEISLEGLFDPSDDPSTMLTTLAENLTITWPDAVTWVLPVVNTGYEVGAPHGEAMTISLTFKIIGEPDFYGGAT